MKARYRLYKRENGMFYLLDKISGTRRSLNTKDKVAALRILTAENESYEAPLLNRQLASVYARGANAGLEKKTWNDVMKAYEEKSKPDTQFRLNRAFRSAPYETLRDVKLIETSSDHFHTVLRHPKTGNSTHHYLRRLHNYAIDLGWLLSPVIPKAHWPAIKVRKTLLLRIVKVPSGLNLR